MLVKQMHVVLTTRQDKLSSLLICVAVLLRLLQTLSFAVHLGDASYIVHLLGEEIPHLRAPLRCVSEEDGELMIRTASSRLRARMGWGQRAALFFFRMAKAIW